MMLTNFVSRTAALLPASLLAAATLVLSACQTSEQEQLDKWMTDLRNEIKPSVQKLPEPKKFEPAPYGKQSVIDPFNAQKLAAALKRDVTQSNKLLQAELNRRKGPLEAYPIDAIAMVGSLNKGGANVALLKADNLLYQARVGEYLGQNFGRITKISETEVSLREIAQDAAGEWIERNANLLLQEKTK
jgi:type IV pilus assembly protein PilP